jgi:hypothetical protein
METKVHFVMDPSELDLFLTIHRRCSRRRHQREISEEDKTSIFDTCEIEEKEEERRRRKKTKKEKKKEKKKKKKKKKKTSLTLLTAARA